MKNYFIAAKEGLITIDGWMTDLKLEMVKHRGKIWAVLENGSFVVVKEGDVLLVDKSGPHSTINLAKLPKGKIARTMWMYGFTGVNRDEWISNDIDRGIACWKETDKLLDARMNEEGHYTGCSGSVIFRFVGDNVFAVAVRRLDNSILKYWMANEKDVTREELGDLEDSLKRNFSSKIYNN